MCHLICVYGTLKHGEPNYHFMAELLPGTCVFRGKARTIERYPLVVTTQFNIPFLLYEPGKGKQVMGEIYEVDDAQLERMDGLEFEPVLYERRITQFILEPNGQESNDAIEISAHVYFIAKYRPELLDLELFESYSHKLEGYTFDGSYLTSESRDWWCDVHVDFVRGKNGSVEHLNCPGSVEARRCCQRKGSV